MKNDFIPAMYRHIDAMNVEGLLAHMTDDASFKFANIPAVVGKENIRQFLEGFYSSIKALNHSRLEYWNNGDVWFKALIDE